MEYIPPGRLGRPFVHLPRCLVGDPRLALSRVCSHPPRRQELLLEATSLTDFGFLQYGSRPFVQP
jgi:hypothetical protein